MSENNNMRIYNQVRAVPKEAQKPITGGRLKGMTDISPMWRIKKLTELFGPAGTGWYTKITNKYVQDGADGTQVAIVDVELYYKTESGEWSMPLCGTGGAMFTDKETRGLYTSDEAFKKAYTDAISVCCKLLGVGADVYWSAGSKYETTPQPKAQPKTQPQQTTTKPTQSQPKAQSHLPAGIKPHDGPIDNETLAALWHELRRTGHRIGPVMEYAKVKSEIEIPQKIALKYLRKMATMPDLVDDDFDPFDKDEKPADKTFKI